MSAESSEYEKVRQENISRNEAFLKEIGLHGHGRIQASSDGKPANKPGRKRKVTQDYNDQAEAKEDELKLLPTRCSSRLRNVPPSTIEGLEVDGDVRVAVKVPRKQLQLEDLDITFDAFEEPRIKITAVMLRSFIEGISPEHSEEISNEAINHCVMRIYTMSNRALGTRMKMIARAAGQHSYEKLLVFHYALALSGLKELADCAKGLLSRLGVVM